MSARTTRIAVTPVAPSSRLPAHPSEPPEIEAEKEERRVRRRTVSIRRQWRSIGRHRCRTEIRRRRDGRCKTSVGRRRRRIESHRRPTRKHRRRTRSRTQRTGKHRRRVRRVSIPVGRHRRRTETHRRPTRKRRRRIRNDRRRTEKHRRRGGRRRIPVGRCETPVQRFSFWTFQLFAWLRNAVLSIGGAPWQRKQGTRHTGAWRSSTFPSATTSSSRSQT